MFGKPYYHRTLRKCVVLFGNLFNNIYVVREKLDGTKQEYLKVPIRYAGKEKFIVRLKEDPELTKSLQISLPRMSFEMVGISYDPTRALQSTIKNRNQGTSLTNPKTQFMGAPYTLNFSLSVYVRNIEDGTMIIEQILPNFHPDYTVTANLTEGFELLKDIPIILDSIQETIDYDGPIKGDNPRMVIWDLQFTMKAWFFPAVSNTAIIMGTNNPGSGVNVDIYQNPDFMQMQTFTFTTGEGDYKEGEIVVVDSRHLTGKVVQWSNTSNTLTITNQTGVFQIGDTVRGIDTHTQRIANTAVQVPQLLSHMNIVQDPLSAGPDDAYGYQTTLTEYPDTL